jgi:hypothetical protein
VRASPRRRVSAPVRSGELGLAPSPPSRGRPCGFPPPASVRLRGWGSRPPVRVWHSPRKTRVGVCPALRGSFEKFFFAPPPAVFWCLEIVHGVLPNILGNATEQFHPRPVLVLVSAPRRIVRRRRTERIASRRSCPRGE